MADAVPEPDLGAVSAALLGAGARFVVIGGFAVVAHRHVRATEDVGLLIPDGERDDARCLAGLRTLEAVRLDTGLPVEEADLAGREHLRVRGRGGLVDLVREGPPPLDFTSVSAGALPANLGDGEFQVAGLRHSWPSSGSPDARSTCRTSRRWRRSTGELRCCRSRW